MSSEFHKIEIDGWVWHARNPELLREWFQDYPTFMALGAVKSNAKRTVFRICPHSTPLYVKFNKDASTASKVLSTVLPKAASEARSALLLEACGIRTAKLEAWGRKGPLSMIVTEEIKDAISAKKFWFDTAAQDKNLKSEFLAKISELVSQLLSARISHPDLHPGNILVVPEKMDLWLIDLYRARKILRLRNSQIFATFRLFGFMRGELSCDEALNILDATLKKTGIANFADSRRLWDKIVEAEEEDMEKIWPKRKAAIESEDQRYVLKYGDWLIRRSITGRPMITPDILEHPPIPPMMLMTFPVEKAKELWLNSFFNDFMRRKNAMNPIAMSLSGNEGNLIINIQ